MKIMRKPSTLLLLLFSLLICLGTISDVVTQPPLDYQQEGIENVDLNDGEYIFAVCPFYKRDYGDCHGDNFQIDVKTKANNIERDNLTYYYFVTGGKIIGEGAEVVWDLSGAKLGEHSITVGVGKDSILKGNVVTKKLDLKICGVCDLPCNCPSSITITAPNAPADAGDTLVFTVNVVGGSQDDPKFNWMVNEGKIVEGQGTPTILVKTTKEMKGRIITATVEIGRLCASGCSNTASASAEIKDK